MPNLVSLVFTWLLSEKGDLSYRLRRNVHWSDSSASSRLLHGVLRLPAVVVVVEGDHVHGELDLVLGHALHAPDVKGVV